MGVCRVNYLFRCLPPDLTKEVAENFSVRMKFVLELLLESAMSSQQWSQAQLPTRLGGLGLSHAPTQSVFAFLAASMSHLFDHVSDEDSVQLEDWPDLKLVIQEAVHLLPETSQGKELIPLSQWEVDNKIVWTDDSVKWTQQKWWMDLAHKASHSTLSRTLPVRDSFRIQQLASQFGGQWLSVIPSSYLGLAFPSDVYSFLLKYRLGLPLLPTSSPHHLCSECNHAVDLIGDHYLTCVKSGHWARHNVVRDILGDYLVNHGLTVQKEVAIEGTERPADLLLPSWHSGRAACVDVTVVHAFSDSTYSGTGIPSSTAHVAEEAKLCKYSHIFQRLRQYDFIPVAIDHLGSPGPHAKSFLYQVQKVLRGKISRADEEDDNDPLEALGFSALSLSTQVSVSLARQIGSQLAAVALSLSLSLSLSCNTGQLRLTA
jgi:hypothetical protein